MSEGALKLTTYFGERSRVRGRLLADELMNIHAGHGIRSSILLRGTQGFGPKHRRRTDRLLTLSEDLPLVLETIDTPARIEGLLADASAIGHEGLMTLERARAGGAELAMGEEVIHPGETAKLTVYLGRHERVNGAPAFVVACKALHDSGVAGATVLLGVDGTRRGERQRARFFARNANVPLMVMSVGDTQRIAAALRHLGEVLSDPLFTVERVSVFKRDGTLLQAPQDQPPANERGPDVRQKLTIIVSEAASHAKLPVYLELVRRLRMASAAGATSLRGIWGFHGDHPPHGDRFLSIRRHVPMVTIAIDTPQQIATLWPIVDKLTAEQGLVTSELIPTSSSLHTTPPPLHTTPPPLHTTPPL
jgi:PII-like signaling protein